MNTSDDADIQYWLKVAERLDLHLMGWTYRLRATVVTKDAKYCHDIPGWLAEKILGINDGV